MDDEEFCLTGLKAILQSIGVDVDNMVDICMSGDEALQCIKNAASLGICHKLIITDIQMPGTNGIEMTKQVRQIFNSESLKAKSSSSASFNSSQKSQNKPFIVGVSGHVQNCFITEALQAGMDMFESKPLYVDRLRKILQMTDYQV